MKKQMGKKAMKILLATDGSANSNVAVEDVALRPFPINTEVRIVSAYESVPRIMTIDPIGVSEEYYAEADQNALKAAENATENAAKTLHQKNPLLIITKVIGVGSPKSVILEEAEKFDADLIIVGSHGYGAVERFMLGSVSHAVALYAKCSVEIVRKKNLE